MTTTFPFVQINTLPDFSMIGGAGKNLVFNIYNSGSQLVDLNGSTITWKLAPYGKDTSVLTKVGTFTGSPLGQFKIGLTGNDTVNLSGRYTQQYTIVDSSGSPFKAQGLLYIGSSLV